MEGQVSYECRTITTTKLQRSLFQSWTFRKKAGRQNISKKELSNSCYQHIWNTHIRVEINHLTFLSVEFTATVYLSSAGVILMKNAYSKQLLWNLHSVFFYIGRYDRILNIRIAATQGIYRPELGFIYCSIEFMSYLKMQMSITHVQL
jgi:hypothetical protein